MPSVFEYFKNASGTNANHAKFTAVAGNQFNSDATKHITGDNHDYHGPLNGDQYFGHIRARVVGGSGHKNNFNGSSTFEDPQLQDIGDNELDAKIALVRAQHENKRLVEELAAIQEQLFNVKEELARYRN